MKWKSYLMVIAAGALVITGCGTQPSATAGKVSSEHAAPKFSGYSQFGVDTPI